MQKLLIRLSLTPNGLSTDVFGAEIRFNLPSSGGDCGNGRNSSKLNPLASEYTYSIKIGNLKTIYPKAQFDLFTEVCREGRSWRVGVLLNGYCIF